MALAKAMASRATAAPKVGKAIEGLRALRTQLAEGNPAYELAVELENDAESFCGEVRSSLRNLRKSQGFDQKSVAELLDMTQSAVSKIENGDGDLGVKTVFRYAHALGLRPVCVFVPTGRQLFCDQLQEAAEEKAVPAAAFRSAMSEAAKAAEEFQIDLVRDTCNRVSSAMAGFARVFHK